MKTINITLLTTWTEYAALEHEWNSLLLQSDSNNAFLTWEWISAWCSTLGKDAKLWIMLARHTQTHQLLGIAPMMVRWRQIKGVPIIRELAFLSSGKAAPDHVDFILHSAYQDELVVELAAFFRVQKKSWDLVHLEGCKNNANAIKILKQGNQRVDYYPVTCPYLALPESWADYLKGLDKKRRYKMGSYRRKLETAYPDRVTYQCISQHDDQDSAISELFNLHQQTQEAQGRTGAFALEANKAFHALLVKRFLANDWLRLYFLRVDNKAIATLYSFNYNGIISFYTTGFDSEWKAYSPGQQIIYYALEQAINERAKEFDFLRGAEDYKFTMTKTVREDIRVIIPQTMPGKIIASALRLKNKPSCPSL